MTRVRGLRGNLKSRSAGLLTSLPAGDRLAARRDLHDVAVNAYTWQRGRPAALIHPRDRRCPDMLRRDPPIKVPRRPPRHDPGAGEPGARPLRARIAARVDRGAGKTLTAQHPPASTSESRVFLRIWVMSCAHPVPARMSPPRGSPRPRPLTLHAQNDNSEPSVRSLSALGPPPRRLLSGTFVVVVIGLRAVMTMARHARPGRRGACRCELSVLAGIRPPVCYLDAGGLIASARSSRRRRTGPHAGMNKAPRSAAPSRARSGLRVLGC
jgi:hypothetical protein